MVRPFSLVSFFFSTFSKLQEWKLERQMNELQVELNELTDELEETEKKLAVLKERKKEKELEEKEQLFEELKNQPITQGLKVFLDAQGRYYASAEPLDVSDSQHPFPSPSLYDTLAVISPRKVPKAIIHQALADFGNGSCSMFSSSGVPPLY